MVKGQNHLEDGCSCTCPHTSLQCVLCDSCRSAHHLHEVRGACCKSVRAVYLCKESHGLERSLLVPFILKVDASSMPSLVCRLECPTTSIKSVVLKAIVLKTLLERVVFYFSLPETKLKTMSKTAVAFNLCW